MYLVLGSEQALSINSPVSWYKMALSVHEQRHHHTGHKIWYKRKQILRINETLSLKDRSWNESNPENGNKIYKYYTGNSEKEERETLGV